ncbi:MAG: alpha-hydroxy-acid oxidizing enzyme [Syntrophus sp. RIFOXYC2_FULL_54_9]|nr:MAG: alpha-hydroxy-acid oxidizing enzyme [Syntrophus sp. RIFOXYC2_FULL_54_9]HBB17996.1 alpha-hydroxy-acid oxidizing enzyme [Syntrophus sp. (in: bacteria)]
MNVKEVREEAKKRFNGICRVCRECNGVVCAGEFPGIGGVGSGASFINNYKALADLRLNMRVIHAAGDPEMSTTLLGQKLSMPILGGVVAGARMNFREIISEEGLATAFIAGARQAGTLAMTGDGPDPILYTAGLSAIRDNSGQGIPITKPRDQAGIIANLRRAEAAGCVAVGIDIDAAGILPMRAAGQPVGPKTVAQLKELVQSTPLPLILKGIMCAEDAMAAREAGAAAIVVSNHGGRVLDHTPGTAEVLPQIARAVRDDLVVLADGGVRSGGDVLKMLALGAHAVLIGRPLATGAIGAGAEGVRLILEQMRNELKVAMIYAGCASVREIGEGVLWR